MRYSENPVFSTFSSFSSSNTMMKKELTRLTDEELCVLTSYGDRSAFELLIERWEKKIYALTLRILMYKQDAEDVTQDIFLKVYVKIRTFNGKSSFKTWLYSVALNSITDYRRKHKQKREIPIDESLNLDHIYNCEEFDETLKRMQSVELLKRSLIKLPERQKAILILKEYNDLTFEEISKVLGCPVSTVKSRLYRGLENIKKMMDVSSQGGAR